MTDYKFKRGDRVRCIKETKYSSMKVGDVAEVMEDNTRYPWLGVEGDNRMWAPP